MHLQCFEWLLNTPNADLGTSKTPNASKDISPDGSFGCLGPTRSCVLLTWLGCASSLYTTKQTRHYTSRACVRLHWLGRPPNWNWSYVISDLRPFQCWSLELPSAPTSSMFQRFRLGSSGRLVLRRSKRLLPCARRTAVDKVERGAPSSRPGCVPIVRLCQSGSTPPRWEVDSAPAIPSIPSRSHSKLIPQVVSVAVLFVDWLVSCEQCRFHRWSPVDFPSRVWPWV